MRIGCCLVSSDLNQEYIDFYPIVHRVWLKLFGIKAKLVLIADEIPASLRHLSADIFLFPPIPGIHSAFQAQCIRLLYPALMEKDSRGDAVLISDIDMIPMNRPYYANSIAQVPVDNFVVYRGNILLGKREIAICYNAATPSTWSAMFGITSLNDIRQRLVDWFTVFSGYDGKHGGAEWNADQRILFDAVMKWSKEKDKITFLNDQSTGYKRLDRAEISQIGGLTAEHMAKIQAGAYSDCHMMRPHTQYRRINHAISTMLFENFPKAQPHSSPLATLVAASLAVSIQHTYGAVLEIGCDPSSTPLLNALCLAQGRRLVSIEENMENFSDYSGPQHALHEKFLTPWRVKSTEKWGLTVIKQNFFKRDIIKYFLINSDIVIIIPSENRTNEVTPFLKDISYYHKYEPPSFPIILLSDTIDVEGLFL